MKKFLSVLAVAGILTSAGLQSANAFSWSSLNPWSKCKCKKEKQIPCSPTGYATPCEKVTPSNPCDKQITKPAPSPCDACDRLQQEMKDK